MEQKREGRERLEKWKNRGEPKERKARTTTKRSGNVFCKVTRKEVREKQ